MDADTARMMADLGQERHDFLAVADEDTKERPSDTEIDTKQEDEGIVRDPRVPRPKIPPPLQNKEHAAKLREWNDPKMIEENTKKSIQNLAAKQRNLNPSQGQPIMSYVPATSSAEAGLRARALSSTAPCKLHGHQGQASNAKEAPIETSKTIALPKEKLHAHLIKSWAEKWAASPGTAREEYYKKYPGHIPYLRPAEKKLIKKAFELAKDPEGRETEFYLVMNKDQRWMFEEARKAKDMFENGRTTEMDRYYAANPQFVDFRKCAEVNLKFRPKTAVTDRSLNMADKTAEPGKSPQRTQTGSPNRPFTPISVPTSTQLASLKGRPETECFTPRMASVLGTKEEDHYDVHLVIASPCVVKKPSLPDVMEGAAPSQAHYQSRFVESYGLDIDSPGNSNTTYLTTREKATVDQAAGPSRFGGAVHAIFRDINGKFRGAETWPLTAPVRVNLDVESMTPGYDPRETVGSIRAFVNHLKSKASTSSSSKKKLIKYKSADDQVWWTTDHSENDMAEEVKEEAVVGDGYEVKATADLVTERVFNPKEVAEGTWEL